MEERIPTLHIAEKYIILIAAVRLLMKSDTRSLEEAQIILEFPAMQEEPFHYDKLYANLIQKIINKTASEFIDKFLCDAKSMNIYYDDSIVADFYKLYNCEDDMIYMLIEIEKQLRNMAYLESGDDYDSHKEKAEVFLHQKKILNAIRVFKDESGLVNKSMLFLDVTMIRFAQSADEMDRFSFRL